MPCVNAKHSSQSIIPGERLCVMGAMVNGFSSRPEGHENGIPSVRIMSSQRNEFFRRLWGWFSAFVFLWNTHVLSAQDIAPYFKTEAGGTYTLLEGNRLVLTCLAEGSWPLEFKWIRNNTNITDYTPEYRFTFASLHRADDGIYHCVVRNRMGALMQTRANVKVAYMNNFTDVEQKKTVPQGRAAILKAPSIASVPPPQVTWFRNKMKIIPSQRITITLDSQLVVLATTAADAGNYYVQAVNERNGENKTSPSVQLSISSPSSLNSAVAPVIVVAPKNTSVVAGVREAILECVANSRSLDKLVVSWKRNGTRRTSGVWQYGRRLTISNPTVADAGLYVCEASMLNSSVKSVEAKAYLSIQEGPFFTSGPKRRVVAEVGKNVEIPCHAKGVPAPRLEWYKDAVPLAKLNNPRHKVTSAMSLQVRKVQPDDAGVFQCFARNAVGEIQAHTNLVVTSMTPSVITPPLNITVTEGSSALFTCGAQGAPKPSVSWRIGSQLLASGSVQIPRFTLLESGGLKIHPIIPSDAGIYTCTAENSEGSVNASSLLTVWSRTFISSPPKDLQVIKGTKAVLECAATYDPRVNVRYVWKKGTRLINLSTGGRISVREGSLHIGQTWSGDIGDYTCQVLSQPGNDSRTARLEVIELPHAPRNPQVSLNETDRRSVLLSWARPFDGNSQLLHFIVELSENNSPWRVYQDNVNASLTRLVVSRLTPARTYQFRVCAVNQVGRGQYSAETNRLMLHEEAPSAPPKNIVASGRTNQSIMVQWQPPTDTQLNGILRGYMLRYRLAGLPGEFMLQNISSAEINYCLLKDLIIWTQYEIQVAAYTGAGLGVYSPPVTEYTLQGVPTAPPQDVEAVSLNSTTIKFTWTPPPQQFINGINQGYKLQVWPEESPETIVTVTIAPEFHGAQHHGYVSGLRKFTWYETAVLCFTTPGDGPPSTPQLIQTHADKPGPVSQLSFTEILDTSLKVSWKEPEDRNGVITGYVLWLEVAGQNGTRVSETLSNATLEHPLTGLVSLTTYTLQVQAVTQAGPGALTSASVSTGLPPELPGAPSNLVISNISPRTATLQFQPGSEGKTTITKWIVEGQAGNVDETEDWTVLCEKEHETNTDAIEIPNLTPFTKYRFRMRQVNLLGPSPASLPSSAIQTLQSNPDLPPTNLSISTTSETSLSIQWVPLPESAYNGVPEAVGYRVRARPADGRGAALTRTVAGGSSRETTVEGLEEWTEYELSVLAFNGVGAGPWASAVRGRTRESVPAAAPVNVSAEAVSSTRILVSWGSVPERQRNGLILGYKLLYREKDSEQTPMVLLVNRNMTQPVLLQSLAKFTLYAIQVVAFTRIGDGPPSQPPTLERTKEDVPGRPVHLLFPEVRLTSVRLVWQPPLQPNGIIMGYQIAYRQDGTDPNRSTTVELGSNARHFTVTGLSAEAAYVFCIAARTQQGWGQPAEVIVITTEKRERPQPPRRPMVPQQGVESRRLQVHWLPGDDGSSPVRYFTLQIRELPDGEWRTHTACVSHNSTIWDVDGLKPYTSYTLRMTATNDVGESALSKETEAVTTLQDVPEEPPVILSVKPSSTTSVLVQWQPPQEGTVNGVLVGYRVYYQELPQEKTQESRITVHQSTAQPDITKTFKTVSSPTVTEFEITSLGKHKRYEVAMTAFNVVGESPFSAPVGVSVGESAPSLAPQSIQVTTVSATQLEVHWEPPPIETQNGNIQGYKIHYWEKDRQNETEKVRVVIGPDTAVKLQNLTCYTAYLMKLCAFNAAGDGPQSLPRKGRTLQAAPSAPSFVTFSEVTDSSLNVSWGVPQQPNGVLEGYRLVYAPIAPVQGVSKVVTMEIKGNWQRWLKIRDLAQGAVYRFRIQARTISYGPELEGNIMAAPVHGSPGSPLETSLTKSASALTLHWSEGSEGAGPVTGYVIEARASDEGFWDTFVEHLSPRTSSYAIGLDRMRPGVSYEFRVIALNRFGYGDPSAPSASMAALSEVPFYEEWWFLVVMALCSLILILLLVFGLLLHGQNRKYIGCSAVKQISTVEKSVTLDNGGFTTMEMNSRQLGVKNTFLKKNGTRSPPRPSPGGLHYSDEDLCNNYNGAIMTENTALTERTAGLSESEGTDSDCDEEHPKHSFVNHYMSDPTYYNSWKRQTRGVKTGNGQPHGVEECSHLDSDGGYYQTVVTQHSVGGVYNAMGQPASGTRTPVSGFSSFV